ncbi:MAG: T9SS type A sorting domain-containing protein [Bacteroidaceae bacterium]|nr:T9SS type A sorting domain-containing protein [Bacteroidaceae bacterium]
MNRTLRKVMLLLLLLTGSTLSSTAESVNALIVQLKNGTKTTFFLNQKPEVLFRGTNLKVVSESSQTTYALSDILRFTYETYDDEDRIIGAVKDPTDISFKNGVLVISQLREGAAVSVYTTDGKLLKHLTAQNRGTYRLNLSTLPQGVYLIKADDITYKITK